MSAQAPIPRNNAELISMATQLWSRTTSAANLAGEVAKALPTHFEPESLQTNLGLCCRLLQWARWGTADAPVQVIEFADFQCPSCARFESTVRATRDKYPTQVAFTLVHFPLPSHEFAESAARAAECANIQGTVGMRSLLFERQHGIGSVSWRILAQEAGVPDVDEFDECVNDAQPMERIEQGKKLADKMGVRGTPTVIVNGWKLPVPPSPEVLDRIINNVVTGRAPTADIDLY